MVFITKGDWIWVEAAKSPSSAGGAIPLGARVLSATSSATSRIVVIDDDGNERRLSVEQKIRIMHPTSIQGVENLVQLEDLHEASVIRNLYIRYSEKLIYTYAGSVLIALNPYNALKIYGNDLVQLYQNHRAADLPPHVFGVASRVYSNATSATASGAEPIAQCIVVDGESGAGKTESIKHILKFLTSVSAARQSVISAPKSISVEQQIMDANLILEAFGNAKTALNNNSSRFGKFVDVELNRQSGVIETARFENYMLETARLVLPAAGESNYHIFYHMMHELSAAERNELALGYVSDYHILTQNRNKMAETLHEHSTSLKEIRHAMKALMFKDAEMTSIFKILAALLHIGNVRFQVHEDSENDGEEDTVEICDKANLKKISTLLQLSPENFANALCQRTLISHGECVIASVDVLHALNTRDALIKGVYARLFAYIVKRINEALYRPASGGKEKSTEHQCAEFAPLQRQLSPNARRSAHASSSDPSAANRCAIGVLDMFGFENLSATCASASNGFEQFCVNFAAEQIHQFYVRQIFKLEQAEYESQHIDWHFIDFGAVDNLPIVETLAVKPLSVISVINDESVRPEASNLTLLEKLHAHHDHNDIYIKPKSDLTKQFGINHFSGTVHYQTDGFLEKNRDLFSTDLLALVESSGFKFLHRIFGYSSGGVGAGCGRYDEDNNNSQTIVDGNLNGTGTLSSARQTKILQFRRSLDALLQKLEQREPFFIRCIKANGLKKQMTIDRELVARQLCCGGVIETTLIQRAGYPVRYDYASFVGKFRMFLPSGAAAHEVNNAYAARHICAVLLGEGADYKFGQTKIFLKARQKMFLEEELEKVLVHYATITQKTVRGWIQRRNFKRLQRAVIILQKHWRAHAQRVKYAKILNGIARLQAVFRSYQLISHYNRLKSIVTSFQAQCRGAIVRQILRNSGSLNECRKTIIARTEVFAHDIPYDVKKEVDQDTCFAESARNVSPENESDEIDEVRHTKFSRHLFEKFAVTYFQGQTSADFSRAPITKPLLYHEALAEQMAALAMWACVQRFMRDLPPQRSESASPSGGEGGKAAQSINNNSSLMRDIHLSMGRNYTRKDYLNFVQAYNSVYKPPNPQRQSFASQRDITERNGSISNDSDETNENSKIFYANFVVKCRAAANAQLVQFIVGHGILYPSLREEIFCQICKQLSNANPSPLSVERGWVLLALCASCFAPPTKFAKYFVCFLHEQRHATLNVYSRYVEEKMLRTVKNGTRCQPPSRLELQACQAKRNLQLSIAIMDDTTVELGADSATTAAEICGEISAQLGIASTTSTNSPQLVSAGEIAAFGFSLYIALLDKVSSLGAGADHVLDAISQSEQMIASDVLRNAPPGDTIWRLFFRRELFTPWHNPSENVESTKLDYHQVVRGVRFGEYRCGKPEELALLCAQQYFLDHGPQIEIDVLEKAILGYLPESEWRREPNSVEEWTQIVLNVFRKKYPKGTSETVESTRAQVVSFAMQKWPLLFSRFCEAIKFAGPPLRTNEVVIAVNALGVYILDGHDQSLLEFSYPEITRVNCDRSKRIGADTVTFHIVNGDEYIFQSPNAKDISALVTHFISGLQKCSKYLVFVRNCVGEQAKNHADTLACARGDLLILTNGQTGESVKRNEVVSVENARSGLHGMVSCECVYVLPTMTKPTIDLMDLFNRQINDAKTNSLTSSTANKHHLAFSSIYRPHTLEQFAAENFSGMAIRQEKPLPVANEMLDSCNATVNVSSTMESANGDAADGGGSDSLTVTTTDANSTQNAPPMMISYNDLWRWSPQPLKRPLLKKVGDIMAAPSVEAMLTYEFVLKYMGDALTKPPAYFLEFTDIIFRAPIKYQILRDEIYCQLMKQLTDNPRPVSEQRGWELMWLCVGLFPPSAAVAKELTRFLKSRYLPLAADCLIRLQKTTNLNGVRKFPPHQVEVEAIQHGTTQIYHKVFLPDTSEIVIEVDSLTNSRELSTKIVSKLHLKSGNGFNIFVKIGEKVISMPENEYLFDFIHQLADWMLQNRAQFKQTNPRHLISYQLFFMRKLWIDVTPGCDMNADLIFHYHQELPKYLRGYHNVSRAQAAQIAALILRAQTRDGQRPPFQQFQHIITDIVPRHLVKSHSCSEWKKVVIAEYEKLEIRNSAEAKIEFLKYMSEFPTYGSAFFEVKQSSDPTLAERVVVAINRNGINLFNQDNKTHIVGYPLTTVNNWTSGNTYFHITIGSLIKGNRLLFETTLGYKMDDLLTSYIQALISTIDKNRRRHKMREIEVI